MNIDEFSDIYIVYADSDHQESLIVLHDFNKCLIILFREGNVVRKGVILKICKKMMTYLRIFTVDDQGDSPIPFLS